MTSADGGRMRSFWDRRADEDAYYFVDNRLEYGRPDLERFWAEGRRDLDELLARLGVTIGPSHVVVEIGCGVGRLTRHLAERAAEVVAIDVSERMLEIARQHNGHLENVRWLRGDGRTLAGVGDASADACISHVVFQHIPDPETTLGYVREVGRVLRPGGFAALQVSNDPRVHRRMSRRSVRALLRAALGRSPRGQHAPEWIGSAVDLGDLKAAAARGGAELERVAGAGTQFCLVGLRRPQAG